MQVCRDFYKEHPDQPEQLTFLLLSQPDPIATLKAIMSREEIYDFIRNTKIIQAAHLWLDYLDENVRVENCRDILLCMIMNSCWTRKALHTTIVTIQTGNPIYLGILIRNLQAIDEFWASLARHKCFDKFFSELVNEYENYLAKPIKNINLSMLPQFYLAEHHGTFSEMSYSRQDAYNGSNYMDSVCSCFTDKKQAADFITIIQSNRLVKIKAIK